MPNAQERMTCVCCGKPNLLEKKNVFLVVRVEVKDGKYKTDNPGVLMCPNCRAVHGGRPTTLVVDQKGNKEVWIKVKMNNGIADYIKLSAYGGKKI